MMVPGVARRLSGDVWLSLLSPNMLLVAASHLTTRQSIRSTLRRVPRLDKWAAMSSRDREFCSIVWSSAPNLASRYCLPLSLNPWLARNTMATSSISRDAENFLYSSSSSSIPPSSQKNVSTPQSWRFLRIARASFTKFAVVLLLRPRKSLPTTNAFTRRSLVILFVTGGGSSTYSTESCTSLSVRKQLSSPTS